MFYVQMCADIALLQAVKNHIGMDRMVKTERTSAKIDICWNILFIICSFFYFNQVAGWNLLIISNSVYNIILTAFAIISILCFLMICVSAYKYEIQLLGKCNKKVYYWSIVSLPIMFIVAFLFGFALSMAVGFDMVLTIVTMVMALQMPLIIVEIFFYIPFSRKGKELVNWLRPRNGKNKMGDQDILDLVEKEKKLKYGASVLPIMLEVAMVAFVVVFFIIPLVKNVDISAIKGSLPQNLFGEGSIIALVTQVLGLVSVLLGKSRKKKEKKND